MSAIKSSDDDEDEVEKRGELAFLPERRCAICYKDQNPASTSESDIIAASAGGIVGSAQTDITNPYETVPCGCIYCFVCIVQKVEGEEGEGWVCLRCGEIVKKCKPWNGDVLEEIRPPTTSGKIVGFAMDEDAVSEDTGPKTLADELGSSQEVDQDEALDHSGQWSKIEKESVDDEEVHLDEEVKDSA
jgi:peroxin-2